MSEKVGTYRLPKNRQIPYTMQCAGDSRVVFAKAGEYPIEKHTTIDGSGNPNGFVYCIEFYSLIEEQSVNRLFGASSVRESKRMGVLSYDLSDRQLEAGLKSGLITLDV